jgi:hypothetical protein
MNEGDALAKAHPGRFAPGWGSKHFRLKMKTTRVDALRAQGFKLFARICGYLRLFALICGFWEKSGGAHRRGLSSGSAGLAAFLTLPRQFAFSFAPRNEWRSPYLSAKIRGFAVCATSPQPSPPLRGGEGVPSRKSLGTVSRYARRSLDPIITRWNEAQDGFPLTINAESPLFSSRRMMRRGETDSHG